MSAQPAGGAARPTQPRPHARPDGAALREGRVIAGTAYVVAMAALGLFAAWPIYADARFLWLGGATVAATVVIAAGAAVWRRGALTVTVAGLVAFCVLGLALAVPPEGIRGLPVAARELFAGAVLGWKDLVTVDLPVGDYRNLVVPAFVVLLVGSLTALRLSWRADGRAPWAAVPALVMPAFGLLFGRTVTSSPLALGPITVPAPRELACGAAALVASILWLGWRMARRRRSALVRAAEATGIRLTRRRGASDVRRAGLAAGMIVVAVGVAAVAAPAVAQTRTRDVLRSGTGPAQAISRAVTPLTDYRANFTDAAVKRPLFTVTAVSGPLPRRVRLATLSDYDGTAYRVDPARADASFLRVPATLPARPGTPSTVRVSVDGLRGIWLPTFGAVRSVSFEGADAGARADAFYYDADAAAGVQVDGVADGERYLVTGTVATDPALASLRAPGSKPAVAMPEAMKTWVAKQNAGTGGAALATLVQRLRARGYLSHALSVPASGAAWEKALGPDYVFQSSASGHSLARVDQMFTRLLERESQPGVSKVAAIGDDEQFSVATALIAESLGFPARVVVGARLSGGDAASTCRGGVCTGADMSVWTEVQAASGQWVPVDVTPQHTEGAEQTIVHQRDPELPTDVRPENAQEVQPPDPTQRDSGDSTRKDDQAANLDVLWAVVRGVGVGVLGAAILVGPFLVVLAAKRARRRSRRGAGGAAAQVVGGWEEYVDAAVDHGLPAPARTTRSELVAQYASPGGVALAVEADRAVFGDVPPTDDEARAFWEIVDAERHRFAASLPWWRRALAAVSLRSFARGILPSWRHAGPDRRGRRGRATGDAR